MLRMTYSESMNMSLKSPKTMSLKNYHVFLNPHKQRDLPCKIILRAFLNDSLFLNHILFVKKHDYVVSQIILFQHKNAKHFFLKKKKQTSKWNVNKGETQNIWTSEVPPGLFYVF